jgi:hypothetical protein
MITPIWARIADAVSSEIEGEVSPGIESDGMDVSGASVVVVACVGVVVTSVGRVVVCASPDESHADSTRTIATARATVDIALRREKTSGTAGRVTVLPNKREHRRHSVTPNP